MAMDPTSRYAVMYRPYHLIGMETPVSIAKAVLYGEATGAPKARGVRGRRHGQERPRRR